VKAARLTIGSYRGQRGRDLAAPRGGGRSRGSTLLRAGAVVVLLALMVGGARWLLSAPLFAVARVESGPFRYSSKEAVDTAFARVLGRNIWTLRGEDLTAACADLPWVREVHLRRRLPNELVVHLIEWQPLLAVAVAGRSDGSLIMVADGRVLAVPEHLEVPGLPLLVGCEPTAHEAGELRFAAEERASLLALVRAMQDTGLEVVSPVDFVRRTRAGYVLELQGGAGSLQVGHGDFARRLQRYLIAPERVPPGGRVDLRFEQRITIEAPETERS
jgi:hypothetical protein